MRRGRVPGSFVPLSRRLWRRAEVVDSGCWEWTGARLVKGYGLVGNVGGTIQAHRAAWLLTHFVIPDGMQVLHRCDNPPCINPAHLFLGTPADNMRDMVAKGRAWWQARRSEAA